MICVKCRSKNIRFQGFKAYFSYSYRSYRCLDCNFLTTTYEIPMSQKEHMMVENLLRTKEFIEASGLEDKPPFDPQRQFIRTMRMLKGKKENEQDYPDGTTD